MSKRSSKGQGPKMNPLSSLWSRVGIAVAVLLWFLYVWYWFHFDSGRKKGAKRREEYALALLESLR